MLKMFPLLCALALLSACQATAPQTQASKGTNALGKLGFKIPKTFQQGKGLLVIGLDVYKMSAPQQLDGPPLTIDGFSIKNIQTGVVTRLPYQPGRANVVELPTGRYCFNSVILTKDLQGELCRAPFFDIEADSVENGGMHKLGVFVESQADGSMLVHSATTAIDRAVPWFGKVLSETEQQSITRYSQQHTVSAIQKTWYVTPLVGTPFVLRLFQDGAVEIQEYTLTHPSYTRGTWQRQGAEYRIQTANYSHNYRVKERQDHAFMLFQGTANAQDPSRQYQQEWLAFGEVNPMKVRTTLPLAGNTQLVVSAGIRYPQSAFHQQKQGDVRLSFSLEQVDTAPTKTIYKPVNIQAESAVFNQDEMAEVVSEFRGNRFDVPNPTRQQVENRKQVIELRIEQGKPVVRYGEQPAQLMDTLE